MTLVQPSTLLDWQRRFIKNIWSYKHKTPGRKPVSKDIKELILQIKQENQLWGCNRIADELKKLGIILNPTTVKQNNSDFQKRREDSAYWKLEEIFKITLGFVIWFGLHDH